jgi:S-adenosylmethionine synthetase
VITRIGYTTPDSGFDLTRATIESVLSRQSVDIALGVDQALESKQGDMQDDLDTGAGDQGMMFGYACDESPEMMPLPIALAHRLTRRLAQVRKDGTLPWLRPDGKSQVTVEYQFGVPARVDAVVISTQHAPQVDQEQIATEIKKHVIEPVIEKHLLDEETKYFINPTGRFVIGGPFGDSGLTGRKIIVDTYGGMARHGGGAFSGKDPTKVDRSAAYAARWVAKNVVAAGLAKRIEVNLAYAIGVARPVSVAVETFGTETVPIEQIERAITETFDLRPAGIIKALDLRRPIFEQTAAYGHFGRTDLDVPWERTEFADKLKERVSAVAR